jgi:histidinol dehydrogenase
MRIRRFAWEGARETVDQIRIWTAIDAPRVDVAPIAREVDANGDAALLALTARFDATERSPEALRVDPEAIATALGALDPGLRETIELAIANVRTVAAAQVDDEPREVTLPQGQSVTLREVPVSAAGIYAPGGRASYPSSVLMGAVPARAAGVERVVLATPPGVDGLVPALVLATAALCEIDDVYAVGGAQAIFALAYGTETIAAVDVVAGPGNAWVREAKRAVSGIVGIDSLAGPSELMVIADGDAEPEWAALDLCAQAEHGAEGPLLVATVEQEVLDSIETATESVASARPGVGEAPLALVQVPAPSDAIDLANAFAPEHLELLVEDAALLAGGVKTAGCVFAGHHSATAFGDYVAGSNHVLPTGGAGRFSGPLGPDVFRRKIATVEVSADAAAKLAPHVDTLARAEGFPVHGESAMIRAKETPR